MKKSNDNLIEKLIDVNEQLIFRVSTLEEKVLALEGKIDKICFFFEQQVLSIADVAKLAGVDRSSIYTSKEYLLPLSHFTKGENTFTRKEVMDHLSKSTEEMKIEREIYAKEHKEEFKERLFKTNKR